MFYSLSFGIFRKKEWRVLKLFFFFNVDESNISFVLWPCALVLTTEIIFSLSPTIEPAVYLTRQTNNQIIFPHSSHSLSELSL